MHEYAEEARERRLSGNHHDGGQYPLTGYCFDNAFVLHNVLTENGYDPQIVAGASDRYSQDILAEVPLEELDEVEDLAGFVHFWVEANGYVIDIAADAPGHFGEILVSSDLPDAYHRLSDSYEYASDVLESARARRCDYCGGEATVCGCPEEGDL